MLRRVLAAGVLTAALAGCGGRVASPPPPQAFSARTPLSDRSGRVTAAAFARPIAAYRRHVRRALTAMLGELARLRAAAGDGDLPAARAAWLRADARYEAIGAAYGAFGDLDSAINATPGATGRLVGLHRVELALFGRRSTRDAQAPAARLSRDVRRLRDRAGRVTIEPLDYALRAHEVLEDALHLQLSGQASPWSSSALNALTANVAGTRVVLRTLSPMIRQRDPLVLAEAERSLTRLERSVTPVRRARWDRLSQRRREAIAGAAAAAAERLAYVPELIDPRPPLPLKRAVTG